MRKPALPYYKAYPRDFLDKTIGMTLELKGAYRVLLDVIYLQSGYLRDDSRYISGQLGCSVRKWESLRIQLIEAGKIHCADGVLTNSRALLEIESVNSQRDKNAENGAKSHKNKELPERTLSHTDSDTDTDSDTEDTDVSITPIIPKVSKPKMIAGKFEEFWSIYPKKQSRGQAESAYAKANKQTDHDEIISGLHRSIQSDHRFQNKQYTPMASTWLNAKGYFDDFSGTNNQTRFNGGSNQHTQSSGSQRQRTGYELAMAAVANLEERERMDGFNPDGRLL